MSIDLRTERCGGSWIIKTGLHEECGVRIAVSDKSAHVTIDQVMFEVDREDVPSAWGSVHVDVDKLRAELDAAIVKHMSPEVLKALFQELKSQRMTAFGAGQESVRAKMREALGL